MLSTNLLTLSSRPNSEAVRPLLLCSQWSQTTSQSPEGIPGSARTRPRAVDSSGMKPTHSRSCTLQPDPLSWLQGHLVPILLMEHSTEDTYHIPFSDVTDTPTPPCGSLVKAGRSDKPSICRAGRGSSRTDRLHPRPANSHPLGQTPVLLQAVPLREEETARKRCSLASK